MLRATGPSTANPRIISIEDYQAVWSEKETNKQKVTIKKKQNRRQKRHHNN